MFLQPIRKEEVHVPLTTGHSIVIPAEGRDVPEAFIDDAMKTGRVTMNRHGVARAANATAAVPTETVALKSGGDEQPPPAGDEAPISADAKNELIKNAIKAALEADDTSLFLKSGLPDARKLDAVVQMPVSAAERNRAWTELQAEAGTGE